MKTLLLILGVLHASLSFAQCKVKLSFAHGVEVKSLPQVEKICTTYDAIISQFAEIRKTPDLFPKNYKFKIKIKAVDPTYPLDANAATQFDSGTQAEFSEDVPDDQMQAILIHEIGHVILESVMDKLYLFDEWNAQTSRPHQIAAKNAMTAFDTLNEFFGDAFAVLWTGEMGVFADTSGSLRDFSKTLSPDAAWKYINQEGDYVHTYYASLHQSVLENIKGATPVEKASKLIDLLISHVTALHTEQMKSNHVETWELQNKYTYKKLVEKLKVRLTTN